MTATSISAHPPPWAAVFGEDDYGIFAEFELREVRFIWRWIPPGRFLMGSPEEEQGRFPDEGPQHEVTISRGFWMGETPVTQAQWQALAKENPSHFKGALRPVENVSWDDGVGWVARLNEAMPGLLAALPTEAQWEYACRAGSTGAFHDDSPCTQPEGEDPALNELGWYSKNSGGTTHEVKQKRPNAWGLFGMHGNVWEWCQDGWRDYPAGAEVDPIFLPEPRALRVVRGGSWLHQARSCRAAFRSLRDPGDRVLDLGFRLVAGQEPGEAEPAGGGAERPVETERRSRG